MTFNALKQMFDYSKGNAFICDGYLYYSPNCSRRVVIPPPQPYTQDPFEARHLHGSQFRQPVWWTSSWGWLAFVPLAPIFTLYPFEPFSWMPEIVQHQIVIPAPPNVHAYDRHEIKYQMSDKDAYLWMEKENLLVEVALKLRLSHGITASPPRRPSSFGFARPHKTRAIAKKMISISRDWFGLWMGYLSYIIAQTSSSVHAKPDPNIPHPYWYHPLLQDKEIRVTLPWLDGVVSSPVCTFNGNVPRAGCHSLVGGGSPAPGH